MAFCRLATFLSLVLAVHGRASRESYSSFAQIEQFNGSSYASVSSNYYLVRFPCLGCPSKNYNSEFLVFNFSTVSDTVLLNGKQIHPQPTHPPEIIASQVSLLTPMYDINYDLSYSSSPGNIPLYPFSRIGYVVNASSQAHPHGSRDSSLVQVNFRPIQVGSRIVDCLDSLELSLFQMTRRGDLAVKGVRFIQNEQSYLPYTDSRKNDPHYPHDDYYQDDFYYGEHFGGYLHDVGSSYSGSGHVRNTVKASVTASGFRKCHHAEPRAPDPDCLKRRSYYQSRCQQSPTTAELIGIILACFVGGVVTTSLVVYFRVILRKWALRGGSVIRCCSASVWRRLRHGRRGAIQLPTSIKENGVRDQDQERK